jgi:hypothetical protein
MEENEDGDMRPLSVGFPWVTRNPFAETASPVVGDGVQASPLIIEPTQISPKNSTVVCPADAVAIVRQFYSPSFNVAMPDVIDSQGPEERRRRPLQTKSFLARVETLTNFHLATHLDDEALKLLTDPSPPITPVDATFPRGTGSLSADHSSIEKMSLPSKEDRPIALLRLASPTRPPAFTGLSPLTIPNGMHTCRRRARRFGRSGRRRAV